jgi:hypothetical protein
MCVSEKIRSQEQAESEVECEDQEACQVAQQTVAKHWGCKETKARAAVAALVGDDADAAAEQYEQRNVDGLKLLVLGSGELVGELSLGVKEPEQPEAEDPVDAARKLVEAARQRQLGHQNSSRKRLERSNSSSATARPKKVKHVQCFASFNNILSLTCFKAWKQKCCHVLQVDYVDADEEIKSAGYPATLVTTKRCNLLSIATTDLLRFGSGVQQAVQTAAWSRQVALLEMQERVKEANEELSVAVSSARSLRGMSANLRYTMARIEQARYFWMLLTCNLHQGLL